MMVAVLFWLNGLYAQTSAEIRTQVDQIIQNDIGEDLAYTPGFIVGIINQDSVYILPYGERTLGTGDSISSADLFELGSITKVLTAQVTLDLHKLGIIALDKELDGYLPSIYQNPRVQCTLKDVLTHHGRFPRLPDSLLTAKHDPNNPYTRFSSRDLMEWYRDWDPPGTPGFLYSNTGYALLELALEHATGERYHVLLDSFIHQNNLGELSIEPAKELTPGYDLAGRQMSKWGFLSFSASAGAKGSMDDMLLLMRYLLQLPEDHLMWTIRRASGTRGVEIGPGIFYLSPRKHTRVTMHAGHTTGHSAFFALNRKTDTAVAVLANSAKGTEDLGLLVLRMLNKQWKRKNP